MAPFQRHPSSRYSCRPIARPPLSLSTRRLSFRPFHPRPSNRGVGIALRLQVISGTRGKECNTIPLPKSFHFYFIFYIFLLSSFSLAQLPLLLLSSPLFCSSSLIRGIHPPLGSTTPGSTRIIQQRSRFCPLARYSGKKKIKKEKRSPMRQRRWKRRRSDIFTDFTQPLHKPFSSSRAWKAVSWKLRENLWEAVNGSRAAT